MSTAAEKKKSDETYWQGEVHWVLHSPSKKPLVVSEQLLPREKAALSLVKPVGL